MPMFRRANNYAFIDGQNLNLGIQDLGWKLDFQRFRVYLKEKYNVSTAFYFLGKMEENNELYEALQNAGYVLIYKEVLTDPFGKTKGNIDAELVLQAMVEYKNYNKAIIVSGDGDFACLVTYLDSKRKLERVIVPNMYRFSSLLKKAAGTRLDSMNELKRELSYRYNRKKIDYLEKFLNEKLSFIKSSIKKPLFKKPEVSEPEKPKVFAKKFRYPRRKSINYSKPASQNSVSQNQTTDQPVKTSFDKPKDFSRKFHYRRKTNPHYTKSAFKNPEIQKHEPVQPQMVKPAPANPITSNPPVNEQKKQKPLFRFRFGSNSIFKKRTP